MTTSTKPIIPNVFEIVYAKPEDRLLAFADRMAAVGEGGKADYLRVRSEILSKLAYLESCQKEDKAYERTLKAAGKADTLAYHNSRAGRHQRRAHIAALIEIRRLSKVWAATARAGDPQMIVEREARCAALRAAAVSASKTKSQADAQLAEAKADREAQKPGWTAAYAAYQEADRRIRRAADLESSRTQVAAKAVSTEKAAIQALHEAERRLTQARAAVAAPVFETTL